MKTRERRSPGFVSGVLAALVTLGCERVVAEAPLVVLPLPGESEPAPASSAENEAPREAPKSLSSESRGASAPDPEARPTREFFEVEFEFSDGAAHLVRARAVDRPKAELPARRLGRFAAELYVGEELVERVRFDFPLLASADEAAFERGLRSRAVILLPRRSDVTRALLVDRKVVREELLPYSDWFLLESGAPRAVGETSAREPSEP